MQAVVETAAKNENESACPSRVSDTNGYAIVVPTERSDSRAREHAVAFSRTPLPASRHTRRREGIPAWRTASSCSSFFDLKRVCALKRERTKTANDREARTFPLKDCGECGPRAPSSRTETIFSARRAFLAERARVASCCLFKRAERGPAMRCIRSCRPASAASSACTRPSC